MKKTIPYLAAVMVAALAGAAVPAPAADLVDVAGFRALVSAPTEVADPRIESWGTASATVKTIHGLGFQESDSTMAYTYSGTNTHRVHTGGFPWFDADLSDLPSGAQLVGLELEACDTNAAQQATVFLFRHGSPNGPVTMIHSVASGVAATPGCAFFGGGANLPAGTFVDNFNAKYFVRVELTANDATTSLGAVRIFYRLRVSPAPAVASFTDVPVGHSQFRFVEALAASGITGGCGGGNYCPDNPVTRGQMAVFLASALGLHFPN